MTINKWQLVDYDQKAWNYLLGAYLFYSLCIFVGYEIARQVGAVAVLCVLLFLIITKGFIRISNRSDKILALLLLFSLVFSSLLNPKTFELLPFIKRIVLCLFLLLAVAYPASPIVRYRYRYLFSLAIIGISAIGLLVFGPGAEYRVTGAFVHTNVMAFVLLLSFMFLSHDENRGLKVFVHISVVLLMLLTSSISALISYFLVPAR